MIRFVQRKLEAIWIKNGDEIHSLFSGELSRNLKSVVANDGEIHFSVFVYHSVEPDGFEQQLRYLADNNYKTIDANALVEILNGHRNVEPKTIALTFDDATGSFWATAFPLLKKYGFMAILFAIPGLVPDDEYTYPNLEDVWCGRSTIEEIEQRERVQPLCTWSELLTMHQSGLVDIQGHSLIHHRINISSKLVDFINPRFDTYFFENINVPISRDESIERPSRELRLGQPIYESASRLRGKPRFLEDILVSKKLIQYVEQEGGTTFFNRFNWRGELNRKFQMLIKEKPIITEFESTQQMKKSIKHELQISKQILENRLPGKIVQHLCYPWFQGSALSDQIAGELGYKSVFYGLETASHDDPTPDLPHQIRRISEEYLLCLPGRGRKTLYSIWTRKFFRFFGKR